MLGSTSIGATKWASLRLDVGAADHVAPFFCFFDNDLAPLRRTERHGLTTEVRELGLDARIIEADVHLRIELRNDVGGRAAGRAQSIAQARLVAGHRLANRRSVRECRRSLRG